MPRYWVPTLKETSIYSEILDRYMNIVVTERTLSLIDEHYGFDNYILNVSIFFFFFFMLSQQCVYIYVPEALHHAY